MNRSRLLRPALDAYLMNWLARESQWETSWKNWAQHTILGAGKALRPTLLFDFYLAASGNSSARPSENLLRLGLALECFHTFTLIHDDLPCMDDDDFRRGRPTLHRLENEAIAVLMGDALHAAAFDLISTSALTADQKIWAIQRMSKKLGAAGLFEGQRLDIDGRAESLEALLHLHSLKTGELFALSCQLGVLAAGFTSDAWLEAARNWGLDFGILFQIQDDLMDGRQSLATLGKTPGKDQRLGRKTIEQFLNREDLKRFCSDRLARLESAARIFPNGEILGDWTREISSQISGSLK